MHCQSASPVNKASGSLRASFSHPFHKPQHLLPAHYHPTQLPLPHHRSCSHLAFSSVICSFLPGHSPDILHCMASGYIPVSACLLKLSSIIRLQTPPHCVQVTPGLDLPAFLPFPPMIPELALSHDLSSDAALALSLSPNSSQNPRLPSALWVY